MKTRLNYQSAALAVLAFFSLNAQLSTARAQSTAFTYQDQLNDSGNPATGSYDLTFSLYESGQTLVVRLG
jgi:hypothetical protein